MNVSLTDHGLIAIALLMATSLVAGFFAYIHSVKRQTYLLLWTAGWSLLALHYLGSAFAGKPGEASFQNSLDHWLFGVAGILFFLGTQLYAQRKPWLVPALIAAGVLAIWAAANSVYRLPASVMIGGSAVYIGAAAIFWHESRRQETQADRLLSVVFFGSRNTTAPTTRRYTAATRSIGNQRSRLKRTSTNGLNSSARISSGARCARTRSAGAETSVTRLAVVTTSRRSVK